ncbi:tetratricopeptide repeat-containing sulfotransferase family protein [Alteromonas oceanisediminis]|uniref:tetratricopeptide repeat-containing sulfotransferase family protein n=1 Tax=Alteromonas oceanisediminis TaxID=2836180 RepID=UPI001BD91F49|nr:sulfotransferase [Alteromonas oceanisediminis]MBT0586052.1 sulfotransferase [Alteromonas oceanisediminis]
MQSLHHDAIAAINQRDYVRAHKLLVENLQHSPAHADSYFLLGIINSELGQFQKAIALIQKALSLRSEHEYYAYLAKCFAITGDFSQALAAIDHCIDTDLSANALDTIGVALSRVGDHTRALHCFERALAVSQNNAQVYYNYAVSLKFSGDFSGSAQAFDQAIALNPDFYQAYFARSDLKIKNGAATRIEVLSQRFSQADSDDAALHYGHALAIEYQQLRRFDDAFNALESAKSRKRQSLNYSSKQDNTLFAAAAKATFGQPAGNDANPRCDSNRPIFVMGMPRSGTTLVERILSGHSQVGSGGELQDFGIALKQLTQTPGNFVLDETTLSQASQLAAHLVGERYIERTQIVASANDRFVDKLPFNFFYANLIQQALPHAKMICLLRDPLDTCIGNYRQLFSISSPYYHYANKLEWIGAFYAQFYHFIQAAAERLPNLLLVDYEQLVASPEPQIKQLLTHCELDFEAQCLAVENNTLPVSTASKVQVREPINQRSIGRWRQFAAHTGPLIDVLKTNHVPLNQDAV